MRREKKLLKNTMILSIGNFFTKLISFFLLPLYTYLLSTKEFGLVDLINVLVTLALPFITLQIEYSLFRFLIENRDNEDKKKKIISTGFIQVVFQIIIVISVFLILSLFIKNDYKYFLMINVIVYCFSSFFQQLSRGLGNNKVYSISSVISAVITILFNILFLVVYSFGARGMLTGMFLGQLACILYIVFTLKIHRYIKRDLYDKTMLKEILKYSLPLIPNAISFWILNASDRFIVTYFLGLNYSGILAAAHKFSSAYIMVYNVFHQSWLESVSEHINDEDIDSYYNKILNRALKIFMSIGFVIISIMPFVYKLMIDKNYYDGYYQLPIIMLGSIFNVLVALETSIYYAKKNTKAVANTSIFAAIINIVVHFILVKKIGLYAASISTAVAYFSMSVYRYFDIKKRYFTIKIDFKNTMLFFSLILITIPAYYLGDKILKMIVFTITIILLLIVNKKEILYFKNLIFKYFKKKVRKNEEVLCNKE